MGPHRIGAPAIALRRPIDVGGLGGRSGTLPRPPSLVRRAGNGDDVSVNPTHDHVEEAALMVAAPRHVEIDR
jgi:hypothetical protein